jgi:hypothetical protein
MIHYHYVRMNAHEQTLHNDHQVEDFKPPYILRCDPIHKTTELQSDHTILASLNDCLSAGHLLLETFLSMTVSSLRTVPAVVYTRMFYAVVVFAKLYVSTQSLHSQFLGMINEQSLCFESYLWRLIAALQAARGTEKFRVPNVFLGMLERISEWCINKIQLQLDHANVDVDDEEWEPMRYMDTTDDLSHIHAVSGVSTLAGDVPWAMNFDSIFSSVDE